MAAREHADLAVLELAEPVPAGVSAAPLLLRPVPRDLVGQRWWAFGFPAEDTDGNAADGEVGEALGNGQVRLDTHSRYPVEPGFSGTGVRAPGLQAVVAVVGRANIRGDAKAITLHQAIPALPGQKLELLTRQTAEQAGEVALRSLAGRSPPTRRATGTGSRAARA